jgi:hypothetical protein
VQPVFGAVMFIVPPVRVTVPMLPPLSFIRMKVHCRHVRLAPVLVMLMLPPLRMYVPESSVTLPLMLMSPLKHRTPLGLLTVMVELGLLLGNAPQPLGAGS